MGVQVLAVAVGGAIGSTLRYATALGAARFLGTSFPFGTFLVNVIGCLLAGFIFGLAQERAGGPHALANRPMLVHQATGHGEEVALPHGRTQLLG